MPETLDQRIKRLEREKDALFKATGELREVTRRIYEGPGSMQRPPEIACYYAAKIAHNATEEAIATFRNYIDTLYKQKESRKDTNEDSNTTE